LLYSKNTARFCVPVYVKFVANGKDFHPASLPTAEAGFESYTKVAPVVSVVQSIAVAPQSVAVTSFKYILNLVFLPWIQ
jgi:hypothetical protein